MKRFLAPIVLLTLLFPSFAFGEGLKYEDLVRREGLYYKKFTDVPFTGKTIGRIQWSFKNGLIHGPGRTYWKNGQLWSKTTWKDGKMVGPSVSYHDNGQLWFKGTYKDGKEEGLGVTYYNNGQLWFKGTYKDGKQEGPWVWYKKDGTVWEKYTGTFKNGVKVK